MRYFISFLVALGLLILVIFLLFNGGGKPLPQKLNPQNLVEYSTSDAQAVMTIDGPVNALQEHNQVRIIVTRDSVTYQQLRGYSGDVVVTRNFDNNADSYAAFLKSLGHAGFTQGNKDPKSADERGFCPLGKRYVFQLTENNQDIERFWATSCGSPKTYLGALGTTVTLFKAQVPDYTDLTDRVNL